MARQTSWTAREPDGVKREVRVSIHGRRLRWQFKRADEARWRYDDEPRPDDWEALEDILTRRAGRGRVLSALATVRELRAKAGH